MRWTSIGPRPVSTAMIMGLISRTIPRMRIWSGDRR